MTECMSLRPDIALQRIWIWISSYWKEQHMCQLLHCSVICVATERKSRRPWTGEPTLAGIQVGFLLKYWVTDVSCMMLQCLNETLNYIKTILMHTCFDAFSNCLLAVAEEMDGGLTENVMAISITQ